ncbi:hypothetical protein BS47DRAFT_1394865 [Hydnum rufescens UP504]|uniref:Actin-like protein n=1 Tax=Hydnum rufescens UP504 TaxID=1448309 RepID=A0A9P6AU52_9AGAM|nr:hypothetical protein BS47DRAFT_1394865 [Hydnum rufescens UP504]
MTAMDMLNVPEPWVHDADCEMNVLQQPNEIALVKGSAFAPSALYTTSGTPSDVFAENPPSRFPKMFVSIDFGATHSGVSYAISSPGEVRQILAWPGSSHSCSTIPTCLVYDTLGDICAWGLEATDMTLKKGWVRCEWFKLWLDPSSAPSTVIESRFFQPPKNVVDLVADYLSCIWMHTKNQIHLENALCSLSHAEVYLTAPSSWGLHASLLLREAAIKAGLVVQDSEFEDIYWQEWLHIIPYDSFFASSDTLFMRFFGFERGRRGGLTICDAGGATVDLATYNVLGGLGAPKMVEAAPRSGCYCGSLFLDLRFRELVQKRLAAHPVHLDEASLAHFVRSFSQSEKLEYQGAEDDTKLFRFKCLHVEDLHDPAVGLDHGELVIPGDVLRHEVFDPIVLHSIATHVEASKDQFGSSLVSVIRPANGDLASCHGGARFGVSSLVSSVIHPQNVFRHVALPAEREDRMVRPVYITSVAGGSLCEHRVEYIVKRGASIVKGGRSELRLCKLCTLRYDRMFELMLYTSNGEQTRWYFDEEEGEELCRCRVDLGTYPSFWEQVEASPFGNFYIDFVLGFEMGSAGRIIISWLC